MSRAGFILVGGRSSRMGRDKALLPFRGALLIDHLARQVAGAAGSVTLVGSPERYGHLPYPVLADRYKASGPLAGIHAALSARAAEWNLILACDMPGVTAAFLRELLERAGSSGADAVAACSPGAPPEPLCAVYHCRCQESLEAWLASGRRKAADWLAGLRVALHPVASADWLRNVNCPEDWNECAEATHG